MAVQPEVTSRPASSSGLVREGISQGGRKMKEKPVNRDHTTPFVRKAWVYPSCPGVAIKGAPFHAQKCPRTSLAVQWLRLLTSTAGGMSSIPGWGTKIPPTARHSQKKIKSVPV